MFSLASVTHFAMTIPPARKDDIRMHLRVSIQSIDREALLLMPACGVLVAQSGDESKTRRLMD
jgi:hypothetical protein